MRVYTCSLMTAVMRSPLSLLADSCNNIICVYNVSASQDIIDSLIKMFSLLPVRLLLHSTLAAADTLPFAGELLPFERR